jgi:hypothetical protein
MIEEVDSNEAILLTGGGAWEADPPVPTFPPSTFDFPILY